MRGYAVAIERGVGDLQTLLVDRAAERMLSTMQTVIESRVAEAKGVSTRDILELQTKRRDFEAKLKHTGDVKYRYYLEALSWMLPSNGH